MFFVCIVELIVVFVVVDLCVFEVSGVFSFDGVGEF